jgi:AraC-like DNA-binding protein
MLGRSDATLYFHNVWQEKVLPSALRLLKAADCALQDNRGEAQRCIAELTDLLLSIHARNHVQADNTADPVVRGGLAPWQLKRVTEFIAANIAQTIRTQDLAAVARLSTGYFSHAFRCSMGQSPYAYVLRRRIEHAQHLMLRTSSPLSQIALDCGLTDQPHFTRLFRKIVGVTPATWRRLRQDGPPV